MAQIIASVLVIFPFRILAWIYALSFRKFQLFLGYLLGRFFHWRRLRLSVVENNLKIMRSNEMNSNGHSHTELASLDEVYRHLGNLFLEFFLILGPMSFWMRRYAEVRGVDNWKAARDKGHGVIFLTSHVGNWEIMAASSYLANIDLLMVTKKLKPAWLHRAIEKGRLKYNVRGVYEPYTMKEILRHLKRNGTVGIVLDQYAGPPIGVRVPFFNVHVGTSTAVAMIAKRTGAAVCPVVNHREANGRVIVEIQPALEWKHDQQVQEELAMNTAHYTQVMESHVRSHPHQWLWIHRRFKGNLESLKQGEWSQGRSRGKEMR